MNNAIPCPWKRLFARWIDVKVNIFIFFFIIVSIIEIADLKILRKSFDIYLLFIDNTGNKVLETLIAFFLVIFLNAFFIGFTGSSIGKLFFGIKILNKTGNRLGYLKALEREFRIWIRGVGLGIVIFLPFMLAASYQRLVEIGKTQWDEEMELQVINRTKGFFNSLMTLLGTIILLLIFVFNIKDLIW